MESMIAAAPSTGSSPERGDVYPTIDDSLDTPSNVADALAVLRISDNGEIKFLGMLTLENNSQLNRLTT